MKRKTLTLTLSLLACFALIGVGFASWVITSQKELNVQGNFVVEKVTDKRLNVTTKWMNPSDDAYLEDGKNPDIVYGKKTGGPNWLTNDGNEEALTAKLEVTVTKKDGSNFTAVNDITVTTLLTADNAYTTARGDGHKYVGALPVLPSEFNDTNAKATLFTDNKTIKIVYTITFTWGEAFGGKNPMEYYKAAEDTINASIDKNETEKAAAIEALKDDASKKLGGLYTDLFSESGVHFNLNLKISLK